MGYSKDPCAPAPPARRRGGIAWKAMRILIAVALAFASVPLFAMADGHREAYAASVTAVGGGSRQAVLDVLEGHEHDSYYLGTPYIEVVWQDLSTVAQPNGDPKAFGGQSPNMHCGGFVAHVMARAGFDLGAVDKYGTRGMGASGADAWYKFFAAEADSFYTFDDAEGLLASGRAEKGDLIYVYPTDGTDNHIGFFWGDTPSENKMWHSYPGSGNIISELKSKDTEHGIWHLVKTEEIGGLSISKTTTDGDTLDNPNYSLAGARFGIYADDACTNLVRELATDANGFATTGMTLRPGIYHIKETAAPKGYALSETVYDQEVRSGSIANVNVPNEPEYARIELRKASSLPAISDGNACYALEGAEYGIFTDRACTDEAARLTTDAGGYACSENLPAGTYFVKEQKAPAGFALDPAVYEVPCAPGQTAGAAGGTVLDAPQNDAIAFAVAKVDAETGEAAAQGGATLAGAEFTVRYYDGYFTEDGAEAQGPPRRTWVLRTGIDGRAMLDAQSLVSGDALYADSAGQPTLPLGTYLIQETKAPRGYLLGDQDVHVAQVTSNAMTEHVATFVAPTEPEQVVRGDLEFVKSREPDQARLANIPFRITSNTTGEAHIAMTDENGRLSTSSDRNAHTQNTNGCDAAVREDGSVDEGALDPAAGIWFGDGRPDDAAGALPFDTYTIEELRVPANEGLALISIPAVVTRHGAAVDLGTLTDLPLPEARIQTQARDAETGTKSTPADTETTLIDRVAYSGLDATDGATYVMHAALMDAESGDAVTDGDGNPVGASVTFTPASATGWTEVPLTFDARGCAGRDVVFFETLTRASDGEVLAEHKELDDFDQTVRITAPSIGTSAVDAADADRILSNDPEAHIADTVRYKHLKPGCTYDVTGTLMTVNEESGEVEELRGADGAPCTSTTSFTPDAADGETTVPFTIDATELAGKRIVVYEVVSRNGAAIARHCDKDDPLQTLAVESASLSTWASDAADGDKELAADTTATVRDEVAYTGLTVGQTYELCGTVMVRDGEETEDGRPMLRPAKNRDGEDATARLTFTPDAADGRTTLDIAVDAAQQGGGQLVVFEKMLCKGKLVASHEDSDDEGQTVTVKRIGISSEALDTADDDHDLASGSAVKLVDTVYYSDLTVGESYAMAGELMVRDDACEGGMRALDRTDGQPVASTVRFTPTQTAGSVKVPFELDTTGLDGQDIVVCESLYHGETLVAEHRDANAAEQTVRVMAAQLSTFACDDATGKKSIAPESTSRIRDTLSLAHLHAGESYTAFGLLLDKETGLPVVSYGPDIDPNAWEAFALGLGRASKASDAESVDAALDAGIPTGTFFDVAAIEEYKAHNARFADRLASAAAPFSASEDTEQVELVYEIDSRDLEGVCAVSSVCIVNDETGEVAAFEADLRNADQSVLFSASEISTYALDGTDDDKELALSNPTRITDTVTYEGLTPGKEYTIEGILMDAQTAEPVLQNGAEVTAQTAFVAEAANGSKDVTFEWDSSGHTGSPVVVFEYLYRDMETSPDTAQRVLVAKHDDINDKDQALWFAEAGQNPTVANERAGGSAGGQGYDKTGRTWADIIPGAAILLTLFSGGVAYGLFQLKKRKHSA